MRDIAEGTRLVLLRHGQTDWNFQHRFQGRADIPLNAQGIAQAEAARKQLAEHDFSGVYASPLARALTTAQLVRPGLDIATDARLMEIDVGTWSGLTWDEAKAQVPGYDELYAKGVDFRRSETGETLAEVVARGLPAVQEIAAAHPGELVLVVAHGLLLNRVIHGLLGLEGRLFGGLGNAHYSEVEYSHGGWRLLSHNVGH